MTKPRSLRELADKLRADIPDTIFEIVNTIIDHEWDDAGNGVIHIPESRLQPPEGHVYDRILQKLRIIYAAEGWRTEVALMPGEYFFELLLMLP